MSLKVTPPQTATPAPQLLNSYEIRLMVRDLITHQAVSPSTLLLNTGVSARQLENPAHRLTLEQELLVYTRIAQHNNDPMLGVRVGARLSLGNYGILGYAMMGAASLHEALQLLTEFAPLVSWASHSKLHFEEHRGIPCTCLQIFPTASDPKASALEIDSTFASFQAVFKDLLGEAVEIRSIEVTHSRPENTAQEHQHFFGCDVEFDSTRNALLISRSELSRRLPHPLPEYKTLFSDLCRQSMSTLTTDRGLIGAIKSRLRQPQKALPALEHVAAEFNISARTLRRQLRSRGASYQGLLDEHRYEEAMRLLGSTHFTVESIGRMLGYADARSFRTAFKRWSGTTPIQFRENDPSTEIK